MRSARTPTLSLAVLTAAIVLLVSAASAAAATIPIKGGEVDWGIKESFRNYVKGPIAGGQIEVSGGAAEAADGTFRFPVGSGTYDTTTHVTEVQGTGTVHFTGHFMGGVPALDLTFSDPWVIVGQTSVVYADVVTKSLATGEIEEFPDAEFALLDASGVMPEFSEEAVTLKDMPAELTAEGAEAFAGFYTEGEELDPLSLTAAFNPTPPVEEPKQEEPKSDPKPAETPAPGPAPVTALPTLKSSGGAAKLGGGGAATVVTVTCPATEPCSLQAPKTVKFKVGDKWFSAKVIAPKWILAGQSAKVTVKLTKAALEELGDGRTKISLKLVLGSGTQSISKVVKATLKGTAAAKARGIPAGGTVTLGFVRCEAHEACLVKAPKQVGAKVEAGPVRGRVLVPSFLGAGAKAEVKVHFGGVALNRLAGTVATFRAKIVVRGSGRKTARVLSAKLKRPAGATIEANPAPSPATPPSSTPIEGEPPILARPATAVTVSGVTLSWMPRDSWVRYVSSGTGASDGVTPGGGATGVAATSSPCPDRSSSSGASLDYTIDFPAKESWYDPFSGEAGIYGSGNVAFRWAAHTINLTAAEPEIEINGSASRAIFRFSGSGGTPYPNQRVALETLETAGRPTVSNGGKTLTYDLMRGRLAENGEKVFAGFYTAPSDNEFGCVSASFTLP